MYLSIWPRTRPCRSPIFAKPNDLATPSNDLATPQSDAGVPTTNVSAMVRKGRWVPALCDSLKALRRAWVPIHPSKGTDAPIAAPITAQTPAPLTVAVDAASNTTLKARRINPVVNESLHCSLHVVVVVVAYVA